MKFSILQENLAKAVTQAARFSSVKAQLPILGNLLLKTDKTKLRVSSTNLEVSVSISLTAKVEEEGELAVPAKTISELVVNLPKETMNMESFKDQLKIYSVGFSSNVLGMNSSDFPKIPLALPKEETWQLPLEKLSNSLSQTLFCTSLDETRPILTGVLFILSKDMLTLVSTDGFRLSHKDIKFENKIAIKSSQKFVLPKNILNEISRLQSENEDLSIGFNSKEKQIVFLSDGVVLSSKVLEGDYPDFESIIPKSFTMSVKLDKEEMEKAVKLASIFARDSANIIKLKISKDAMKIAAESGQSGRQETKVDIKTEKESDKELEIAFNYRFLEEFLHSVKGEEVKIDFSGATTAAVFSDPTDPTYFHLIMPIKLQG